MPSIIEVDTIKNKTGTQNTVLSTDGSGNNTLNANTIKDGSATKTLAEYSSNAWSWGSGVPADTIVQVKSATFDGVQTIGTNEIDVTNLSCSMTITSGNKVLIFVNLYAGQSSDAYGVFQITDGSNNIITKNSQTSLNNVVNSSMAISAYNINNDIHTVKNQSLNFLWTPGVTSITVKVRAKVNYGANIHINRTDHIGNAAYNNRTVSNLTIMEVQA